MAKKETISLIKAKAVFCQKASGDSWVDVYVMGDTQDASIISKMLDDGFEAQKILAELKEYYDAIKERSNNGKKENQEKG